MKSKQVNHSLYTDENKMSYCSSLDEIASELTFLINARRKLLDEALEDSREQNQQQIVTLESRIEMFISKLAVCKIPHKAMNIAHGYLLNEIFEAQHNIFAIAKKVRIIKNMNRTQSSVNCSNKVCLKDLQLELCEVQQRLKLLQAYDSKISRYVTHDV